MIIQKKILSTLFINKVCRMINFPSKHTKRNIAKFKNIFQYIIYLGFKVERHFKGIAEHVKAQPTLRLPRKQRLKLKLKFIEMHLLTIKVLFSLPKVIYIIIIVVFITLPNWIPKTFSVRIRIAKSEILII